MVRRAVLALAVGSALAALGASGPASAAVSAGPRPLRTVEFGYAGPYPQSVTVPSGAAYADVRVIGGHGGAATAGTCCVYAGGDGAQISGRLPVYGGEVLELNVAGGGAEGTGTGAGGAGGWGPAGPGGPGGHGSGTYGDVGGGGGGASSIVAGSVTVVVASGGGGGGGKGFESGIDSGGPGGSAGEFGADPGHNGKGPGAGGGGAGAANSSGGGTGGGGASWSGGGGGGGGAGVAGGYGGGGGGFGGGGGGGGGAGSWTYASMLQNPHVSRGTTSDGNGLIVITWDESGPPVCYDQTVQVPLDSPGVPVQLRCSDPSLSTSFRIVTLPDHGHLDHRNLAAGTFTYVPLPGYAGTDSAVFEGVQLGLVSAPAIVTFAITAASAATTPVASSAHAVSDRPPVLTVTKPAK
jgi:hypothetical protein